MQPFLCFSLPATLALSQMAQKLPFACHFIKGALCDHHKPMCQTLFYLYIYYIVHRCFCTSSPNKYLLFKEMYAKSPIWPSSLRTFSMYDPFSHSSSSSSPHPFLSLSLSALSPFSYLSHFQILLSHYRWVRKKKGTRVKKNTSFV